MQRENVVTVSLTKAFFKGPQFNRLEPSEWDTSNPEKTLVSNDFIRKHLNRAVVLLM